MDTDVDRTKQAILARLVAAETDAQHKIDTANAQAQQTVAQAKDEADALVAAARRQAAADATSLVESRKAAGKDEADALRADSAKQDAAMTARAQGNLDAAVTLVVDWVTRAGA